MSMQVVLWNGDDNGYVQDTDARFAFGPIETAKRFKYSGMTELIIEVFCREHNLCIVEV